MRKMVMLESSIIILLLLVAVFFLLMPVRSQMLVYPLARKATQLKLAYQSRDMAVYETTHFTIKYEQQDADIVPMVAQAAEKAYQPVIRALGFSPEGKTLVVMYSDKKELNAVFGWSGDQSAMGVYWGGVIQILSPRVWLKDMTADEFIRTGPMVHEFTHLVFDRVTEGNYPRWFTEGLAQYVEYKVNSYEWRTNTNSMSGRLYAMGDLDENFDSLPDTSLAYRESFAAVRYIAEVHGEAKLNQVIQALRRGQNIKQAVTANLGMDYDTFAGAWQRWARDNM